MYPKALSTEVGSNAFSPALDAKVNSEKKYLESARTLTPALGENGQRRKSMPGQETEVRRLSSLFNAAAEGL